MSKRTTRKKKAVKKLRKAATLNGGFFPSVYGGVTGASMLAPLIARQALRMYNSTPNKRKTSNQKKTFTRRPKKTFKNKKSRKNTQ